MVFATLILAVALILATQMICTTWRDIRTTDQEVRLEISRHLRKDN